MVLSGPPVVDPPRRAGEFPSEGVMGSLHGTIFKWFQRQDHKGWQVQSGSARMLFQQRLGSTR